jgi:hypothetical protein
MFLLIGCSEEPHGATSPKTAFFTIDKHFSNKVFEHVNLWLHAVMLHVWSI